MNTYWDAAVYDRIGTPMRSWAQQVIADLALRGDEVVLDAGYAAGERRRHAVSVGHLLRG